MNRRDFIKHSCIACFSGITMGELLQSCTATKYASGVIDGNDLVIPLSEFLKGHSGKISYRPYILVKNDKLKFPICIFHLNGNEYEALWLQCTHQGNELQVFGDRLQCPAHGSEFDNRGNVQNGPAEKSLRKFSVTVDGQTLKVSLTNQ